MKEVARSLIEDWDVANTSAFVDERAMAVEKLGRA
jgi:hypothetical protein